MTDAERIENLQNELHNAKQTAESWRNACKTEIETNANLLGELKRYREKFGTL